MNSLIASAIHLATNPVALTWSDTRPESAVMFSPGKWGCVMTMFGQVATKGKMAAFDRQTYGCWGGGVGLGFGNRYEDFPGGVECFCHFLSTGNRETQQGRAIGEGMAASGAGRFADSFLEGERYIKSPDTTRQFVDSIPMIDIPKTFVVLKPLSACHPDEDEIKSITFFADPDQISALVVLANYIRPQMENVAVPWAAACQVAGIFAYRELSRQHPRALIGLTDISARKYTRASLGPNVLALTIPYPLFGEMERNVKGSFLEHEPWVGLMKEKG